MRKRWFAVLMILAVILSFAVPVYADGSESLSASSIQIKPGESSNITAYSGTCGISSAIWSSSDETVASVDGYGKVTGIKLGRTVITAVFPSGGTQTCTVNVAYKGVDVSEHNGSINWTAVKNAGIDYAMIRTGYGGDLDCWSQQTDSQFEANYSGAVANGLKVGAYHYSYATNVTMAANEADFCIHILNGRRLDYPVVYDVEDKSQYGVSADAMGQIVQTFCSKLQQAGYKVAVYSYVNFYNAHLTSSLISQYDTWIAETGGVSAPGFSRPYTMWQYAQESIANVGTLDVDYSYCDYAGTGSYVPSANLDPNAFLCDTASYTFGTNKTYIYKITTADTFAPTAASSNSSAVTVSSARATANGFLFTITNVGSGTATIKTTAGDGRSVSFQATGTGTAGAAVPSSQAGTSQGTMRCDTTYPYTFGTNSTYCFKVISSAPGTPTAVSSNPSAVSVSYRSRLADGYLFQINNVGTGAAVITAMNSLGQSVSFTANGTASASSGIRSDTPFYFTMKKGNTYQFKFTGASGMAYSFSCANGSVIRPVSCQKIGASYYYKISGVGGGCTGIYASAKGGSPVRVSIVTVI